MTRWTDSLLVRGGALLVTIALLAVASIAVAALYADYSAGRGTAINLAGSLRMQTWRIAALMEDPRVETAAVREAIDAFERNLQAERLVEAVPGPGAHPAGAALDDVRARWSARLRPMLDATLADGARRIDTAEVDAFVRAVDRLVGEIEAMLERSINELRLIQGMALFVMLVLIVVAMYYVQSRVVDPLGRLVGAARRVQALDFDTRVDHVDDDELGELGAAFNRMVEEVSGLTRHLEDRVAAKTAELEVSHRTLETLYAVTRVLGERPPDELALRRILDVVRDALGAEASLVCSRTGEGPGMVVAGASREGRRAAELICGFRSCGDCVQDERPAEAPGAPARQVVSVPLRDAGTTFGVLPIAIARERRLERWELQLLETVGRHIGAALRNAERLDAHRSFALYEERAAIARELHDSLAQSLSYLKIQATRLEKSVAESGADDPRRAPRLAIIEELRTGLSAAYRELRELLTTFRLRIDETGFAASLEAAVADFERRTGVAATLEHRLGNLRLSAHEQVHVLQIVREALANVGHHAKATRARVELEADARRRVRVAIVDDGVGVAADVQARPHHYGTTIMRDRATTLGGTLRIGPAEGGGTRVELGFDPKTPFAAGPAEGFVPVELRRDAVPRAAAAVGDAR